MKVYGLDRLLGPIYSVLYIRLKKCVTPRIAASLLQRICLRLNFLSQSFTPQNLIYPCVTVRVSQQQQPNGMAGTFFSCFISKQIRKREHWCAISYRRRLQQIEDFQFANGVYHKQYFITKLYVSRTNINSNEISHADWQKGFYLRNEFF